MRCFNVECPDKIAAAKVLMEGQDRHHMVRVNRGSWTLKHPIYERLGDQLFSCGVANQVVDWLDNNPEVLEGLYRVHADSAGKVVVVDEEDQGGR